MGKDLASILSAADQQGFALRPTRRGHVVVTRADGSRVTTVSGTGNRHTRIRVLAQLRRAGFDWPQ